MMNNISDCFSDFLRDEVILCDRSSKTIERYQCFCRLLINFLGNKPIDSVSLEDTRKWREMLYSYQKPDTVRGYIVCLKCFFKYCQRKGRQLLFDTEDIKIPKREKRILDIPTEDEVEEFISILAMKRRGYCNANRLRNVAIGRLIFSSGIRVSEACSLNRNSIKNRQFTIIGKSRDSRICFIDSQTEKCIADYLNIRTDNNPALFISYQTEKRMTPGNVRNAFEAACARSDGQFVGVRPHALRHSFATKMLNKHVDLRYIGDLMGHADLNTTKVYTHYTNPQLRAIYDRAHGEI